MKTNIITVQQYTEILNRLDALNRTLEGSKKIPEDSLLDNQELIKLLNISKRTAQSWRDEGKISFSQIGSKIYYKMSDVQRLLDTHYKKAFSKVRNNF